VNGLDVLAVGEAIVDFFPDQPGIALCDVDTFHRHLGGAPSNVTVGVARLGGRAGLMTLVGDDGFGSFLRVGLSREGVDVTAIGTHRTARTGITFITVGPKGERSFHFYRHPSADMLMTVADVDAATIRRSRFVHFGSSLLAREPSRQAMLHALSVAREAGCLMSWDPNWRPHVWDDPSSAPALIREALRGAAVLKISDDELAPIAGTGDVARGAAALRGLGIGLVVVTLGARGCYYDAPCGTGALPGERVTVVDTTGAGDGFMAGLLSRLAGPAQTGRAPAELTRVELEAALGFANRVGARVVTRFGATAALPRLEEMA
jgi:fructokinase